MSFRAFVAFVPRLVAGFGRGLVRLGVSERGILALTTSQMFMGALTIGFAVFRGTSAYEGFHYETQVGHANYGASKVAGDHARAANINSNNNVVETAIMGPRFSVEADAITMVADAAIACPQTHNPPMVALCAEFHANFPRMVTKLIWVRLKQAAIWAAMDKLTQAIDKVMSLAAVEQIRKVAAMIDGAVNVRVEDPSQQGGTWGGDSTKFACDYASIDALASIMPESAWPILMHQNLLVGVPEALVAVMPQLLCGGGGTGGPTPSLQNIAPKTVKLGMIPDVTKAAQAACNAIENEVRRDLVAATNDPTISKYLACAAGPCAFDRAKCDDDQLEQASASFLEASGLPKISSTAASLLNGSTRAPADADWNWSNQMRACSFAQKDIDSGIIQMNDTARTVMTFGHAKPSQALRERREYQSCGKWYFPDGEGRYAGTPHDQQPFVAGWKHALVGAQLTR